MENQTIYNIPSQRSSRETVAVEMNNFSEPNNEEVLPQIVYVRGVKPTGKDYMCCSVFNIMFCNCLFLGLAALICSLKARSKMTEGDMVEGQKYSRRAFRTNTAAVILTTVALTVFLVLKNGAIFHSSYELSSGGSNYHSPVSSFELSFDIERQKSKHSNFNDRSRYNSYPSGGNFNRSPQRPSYNRVKWKVKWKAEAGEGRDTSDTLRSD